MSWTQSHRSWNGNIFRNYSYAGNYKPQRTFWPTNPRGNTKITNHPRREIVGKRSRKAIRQLVIGPEKVLSIEIFFGSLSFPCEDSIVILTGWKLDISRYRVIALSSLQQFACWCKQARFLKKKTKTKQNKKHLKSKQTTKKHD